MKRHPFSMVEILLTLGVVAIGICSVMVLFPVGATATRDASMETYAANVADQMLHMIKYKLFMKDSSNVEYWYTYICNGTGAGRGLYSASPIDLSSMTADECDDTDKWSKSEALIGGNTLKSGIYAYTGDSSKHYYQIVVHRDDQDKDFGSIDETKIDFRAVAAVWADKVKIKPDDPSDDGLPLQMATRLHMKVQWPVELPPSARQSAYYTLEIFHNAD